MLALLQVVRHGKFVLVIICRAYLEHQPKLGRPWKICKVRNTKKKITYWDKTINALKDIVFKMGNEFEEFKLVIGKDKSEMYPVPLHIFSKN